MFERRPARCSGSLVAMLSGPLAAVFAVISLGIATHGLLTAWAVYRTPWTAAEERRG